MVLELSRVGAGKPTREGGRGRFCQPLTAGSLRGLICKRSSARTRLRFLPIPNAPPFNSRSHYTPVSPAPLKGEGQSCGRRRLPECARSPAAQSGGEDGPLLGSTRVERITERRVCRGKGGRASASPPARPVLGTPGEALRRGSHPPGAPSRR